MMYRFFISLACSAFLLVFSNPATSDTDKPLIFTTAPTHSAKVTREIYTPIVNYLGKVTGRKIEFYVARNFLDYTNKFKQDYFDIVFDGPHFVGWRMDTYNHVPLARFPGKIKIIVIGKKKMKVKSMADLAGRRVCAFPSPNMLTMAFLQEFDNPIRQPIFSVARGFKGLEKCLRNDRNYAAVLRDKMWGKLKKQKKDKDFYVIYAPKRGYPERTFAVSKRVTSDLQKKIADALVSAEGLKAAEKLLKTFRRKTIVRADIKEYENLGKMMANIWGYRAHASKK
jgi:ABC-type phosphate/phosphonate transport system substrate-binding protein